MRMSKIKIDELNLSAEGKELLLHCLCEDGLRYSAEEVAKSKFLAGVA